MSTRRFYVVPFKVRGRKLTYRVRAGSQDEAEDLARALAKRYEKGLDAGHHALPFMHHR